MKTKETILRLEKGDFLCVVCVEWAIKEIHIIRRWIFTIWTDLKTNKKCQELNE